MERHALQDRIGAEAFGPQYAGERHGTLLVA
jgi:hypothetical protein